MGLTYRKYKKGLISKKDFKRSAKLGAVQTASQLGGASGGAAVGFAIGSVASVPGAIIGTVIGGIVGGLAARKIATKVYEKIEMKMSLRVKGILTPIGQDRSDEILEVEDYWGSGTCLQSSMPDYVQGVTHIPVTVVHVPDRSDEIIELEEEESKDVFPLDREGYLKALAILDVDEDADTEEIE